MSRTPRGPAFRDDHDAALARVDALEAEVERLRAERDQALAALSDPPPPAPALEPSALELPSFEPLPAFEPPPPRPTPAPAPRARTWGPLVVGALTLAPMVPIWLLLASECADERARHERARAAIGPCLDELPAELAAQRDAMPDRFEPARRPAPALERSIAVACSAHAATLALDDELPRHARARLAHWDETERALDAPLAQLADYYRHRDWEEDDMRGARTIWKRLAPLLAARDAAIHDVRETVLPILRGEAVDE